MVSLAVLSLAYLNHDKLVGTREQSVANHRRQAVQPANPNA